MNADDRALARQDSARDLGVFVDDILVRVVPAGDRHGERSRAPVERRGLPLDRVIVLTICNDHPDTAAVACDRHED